VPKDTQSAPALLANAHVDAPAYARMYAESVRDPEAFWGEHGKRSTGSSPYTKVKNTSFAHDNVDIRWFEDGTLNVAANCIDRHLAKRGDQTAIIFEPDDPKEAGAAHHLQAAARRGLPHGQCPEGAGRRRATASSSTCR
jgi:acetyl-CoA synthetase